MAAAEFAGIFTSDAVSAVFPDWEQTVAEHRHCPPPKHHRRRHCCHPPRRHRCCPPPRRCVRGVQRIHW